VDTIIEKAKKLAEGCGFSHVGELRGSTVRVMEEVRAACEKCNVYGKNWACPPACGTLSECEARIRPYKSGLILQTTGILEDSFDWETIEKTAKDHDKNMRLFGEKAKEQYPASLLLGANSCKQCETCTYPDAPCRFPERVYYSMEAFGILVSGICKDNGLPYYYGPNTLTYVGVIFIE
jgi:predicted metal-binding protein